MISRKTVAAAALAMLFGSSALAAESAPAYVKDALDYMGRTRWDQERDPARKPGDIIAFSQIKPGMVVVDLVPGDTYYTRILSRLVGPKGKVYAVVPGGGGNGARGSRQNQRLGKAPSFVPEEEAEQCILGCYPDLPPPRLLWVDYALALENTNEFRGNVIVLWQDLSGGDLALPEPVDAVFSVGGYHVLHTAAEAALVEGVPGRTNRPRPPNVAALNQSVFEDLKPGGVFLVADNAAAKGAGFDAAAKLSRTEPDAVKAEVTSAGFALDGESKVLAQTSDDHGKAVGGKFVDRDSADQFVFRFKKPVNAPAATKRPTPQQEAAIMKNYYGNTHILRADLTVLNTGNGNRLRYHYYNADHTYQEMGRVGEGVGPLQEGTWWWSAKGNNCMLHQYPIDERGNLVCHDYVIARPIGQLSDEYPDRADKGAKMNIVPGHVRIP